MTDGLCLSFQDNMPLLFIGDEDDDNAISCPSLAGQLSQQPTTYKTHFDSFHICHFFQTGVHEVFILLPNQFWHHRLSRKDLQLFQSLSHTLFQSVIVGCHRGFWTLLQWFVPKISSIVAMLTGEAPWSWSKKKFAVKNSVATLVSRGGSWRLRAGQRKTNLKLEINHE